MSIRRRDEMIARVLVGSLLLGIAGTAVADGDGNFEISAGTMLVSQTAQAEGEEQQTTLSSVPVSILLDKETGKSWVLVAGPTGQWARITFAGQAEGKEYEPHE
jgi:hypothetical protein